MDEDQDKDNQDNAENYTSRNGKEEGERQKSKRQDEADEDDDEDQIKSVGKSRRGKVRKTKEKDGTVKSLLLKDTTGKGGKEKSVKRKTEEGREKSVKRKTEEGREKSVKRKTEEGREKSVKGKTGKEKSSKKKGKEKDTTSLKKDSLTLTKSKRAKSHQQGSSSFPDIKSEQPIRSFKKSKFLQQDTSNELEIPVPTDQTNTVVSNTKRRFDIARDDDSEDIKEKKRKTLTIKERKAGSLEEETRKPRKSSRKRQENDEENDVKSKPKEYIQLLNEITTKPDLLDTKKQKPDTVRITKSILESVPRHNTNIPTVRFSPDTTADIKLREEHRRIKEKYASKLKIWKYEPYTPKRRGREKVFIYLTKKRAHEIFGFTSRLGVYDDRLLRMHKLVDPYNYGCVSHSSSDQAFQSLPSIESKGPDRSWIVERATKLELDPKDFINIAYQKHLVVSLSAFWILLTTIGRMPFTLHGLSETNLNKRIEYTIKLSSFNFVFFCVTSYFLFFILMLSTISTIHILSRNGTSNSYEQLELLYYQKYWLQYCIFIAMLIFTLVFNLTVFTRGIRMARYVSDLISAASRFQCDASKRVWLYCTINIGSIFVFFGFMIYQFIYSLTPGMRGGTATIAISLAHFIVPGIRLNLPGFEVVAIFTLILQMYVTLCSRLCILIPCVLSVIIRNLSTHWNFRIGIALNKIKTHNDHRMGILKRRATCRYMFRYHNVITALVRDLSGRSFVPILLTYFGIKFVILTLIMYKISKTFGITFNLPVTDKFGGETGPEVQNITIETYKNGQGETAIDALFQLFLTVFGFVITSEVFARCSHKVREGYYYVRRRGLFSNAQPQERKFVISLMECYSNQRPLLLAPGNYLELARPFIVRTLMAALLIFSVMVQSENNSLINTPILGLCNGSFVCIVGIVNGKRSVIEEWNNKVIEILKKNVTPTSPTTTTAPTMITMITTMKPPKYNATVELFEHSNLGGIINVVITDGCKNLGNNSGTYITSSIKIRDPESCFSFFSSHNCTGENFRMSGNSSRDEIGNFNDNVKSIYGQNCSTIAPSDNLMLFVSAGGSVNMTYKIDGPCVNIVEPKIVNNVSECRILDRTFCFKFFNESNCQGFNIFHANICTCEIGSLTFPNPNNDKTKSVSGNKCTRSCK